jgi:Na+/melibiose symporter-like transporter
VLTLLMPTIAAQIRPDDGKLQLALMGALVLASIPIALFFTLRAFPDEVPTEHRSAPFSIGRSLRAVFGNPLLLRVLASDFAVTLGQSIRGAVFVFFVSFYMGRPDWAAALFLFQFVFGIVAGPIWLRIGRRFGKHRTAVLGEVTQMLINLGLLLLTPDRFGLLLALTLAQGLAQGSGNLMLRAIVADVADKQRLETGEESTGLYYSVFTLAGKLAAAVAIGVALPLIAWFGFDPKAVNTPQALDGLLYVFALGPALAHALSALLVFGFPLDEQAHSEIRRQLDAGPTVLAPAE